MAVNIQNKLGLVVAVVSVFKNNNILAVAVAAALAEPAEPGLRVWVDAKSEAKVIAALLDELAKTTLPEVPVPVPGAIIAEELRRTILPKALLSNVVDERRDMVINDPPMPLAMGGGGLSRGGGG